MTSLVEKGDRYVRARVDFQGDPYLESAKVAEVRPDGAIKLTKDTSSYPARKWYTPDEFVCSGWVPRECKDDAPRIRDAPGHRWYTELDIAPKTLNFWNSVDVRELQANARADWPAWRVTAFAVDAVRLMDDAKAIHFDPEAEGVVA